MRAYFPLYERTVLAILCRKVNFCQPEPISERKLNRPKITHGINYTSEKGFVKLKFQKMYFFWILVFSKEWVCWVSLYLFTENVSLKKVYGLESIGKSLIC